MSYLIRIGLAAVLLGGAIAACGPNDESYGYAGGPGAGALLAKAIATGEIDERIRPFALDRFDRDRPVHDAAVVLASH